jgi:hypothetical protein
MQEIQQNNADRRVWPKLPGFIYDDLCSFAKEERRTPSEMAAIFIENGIKERKRKRKNAKED